LGVHSARVEQPPSPCHPNSNAAGDDAAARTRGDVVNLPDLLKERLAQLANRPHTYLPLQVFNEADGNSQLFQYYLLDTSAFEPNVFTTISMTDYWPPRFAPSQRAWVLTGVRASQSYRGCLGRTGRRRSVRALIAERRSTDRLFVIQAAAVTDIRGGSVKFTFRAPAEAVFQTKVCGGIQTAIRVGFAMMVA
jgi:hypothetical protein